jgi:hypothetical protein
MGTLIAERPAHKSRGRNSRTGLPPRGCNGEAFMRPRMPAAKPNASSRSGAKRSPPKKSRAGRHRSRPTSPNYSGASPKPKRPPPKITDAPNAPSSANKLTNTAGPTPPGRQSPTQARRRNPQPAGSSAALHSELVLQVIPRTNDGHYRLPGNLFLQTKETSAP